MATLTDLAQRIWSLAGAVSVRTKIMGIILGLVLLMGLVITVQVRTVAAAALQERLQSQGVSIAHDLAARSSDLILINDLFALQQLLDDTSENNADVRYAFIVDPDGAILAHTFGDGFPPALQASNSVEGSMHHHTVQLETDEGPVWDIAAPIFGGRAGTVRVGLTEFGIHTTTESLTAQMLLTTVLVSAIGIAAAALLTWLVTRPILDLKDASLAVGRGDFSQRVKPWAADEIGELAEAFNVMTADLAQADQERSERDLLRTQLLEKVITAQEEERRRIARELHDETGQSLTSLMVRLQNMNQQWPLPEFKQQIDELRHVVGQTLDNVHNMSRELRPSALDDLGLEAALGRYVQDYRALHSIDVDLVILGLEESRLPPTVETAIYRIVQEGLTNIARHANANTASVLIERRDGAVRVIIEDNGIGFDPASADSSGRLGLYGMRERAELLNGTLTIESSPDQGTTIFVQVPL